jgi:hypothetical protein
VIRFALALLFAGNAFFFPDWLSAQSEQVALLLRQADSTLSPSRLSRISDSLVAVAKAAKPYTVDPVAYDKGHSALVAFTLAGREDPDTPGTPYAAALDKLILLHKEGPPYMRGPLLYAMRSVTGRPRLLAYLNEVMLSSDETAWVACHVLTIEVDRGSPSSKATALQLLRNAYRSPQPKRSDVSQELSRLAGIYNWYAPATPFLREP